MSWVCGVDTGSLKTPSYVAWCDMARKRFYLDQYLPTREKPLPEPPAPWPEPAYIGFDAPQGLPAPGEKLRLADKKAGVPTRKLPRNRDELSRWNLYKGLIESGVEIFWSVYSQKSANIPGMDRLCCKQTVVFETYPRYIIRRLWPQMKIPSKNREPLLYSTLVYRYIQEHGFGCPGLVKPTHDQVDAMLCALAAYSFCTFGSLPPGTVGRAPFADETECVLREGLLVAP